MGIPHTFIVRVSHADQVNVIGDFNNWQTTAHSLEKIGDDLWRLTLDLPAGRYRYAYFVIDSRWHTASELGLPRTRIEGQGSWALISSDNWKTGAKQIHLSPTIQQLTAA